MLSHLYVSNYALIDELNLDFDSGLTMLTGETGAGKSILLGALKLVLGERADLKAIKNADKKCIIEAHFNLKNLNLKDFFEYNDVDYDDETILRREILPSGKSRAFVNDVPVTLKILNELSQNLIDIHSQFETADLLQDEFQFNWIDAFANQQEKVDAFFKELIKLLQVKKEIRNLETERATFQKQIDYHSFLFNELVEADLEKISVEALEQEQYLLENAEEVVLQISESLQIIENDEYGILNSINNLTSKSKLFSSFLSEKDDLKNRIDSLNFEIKDIAEALNNKLENIEINPERLQQVREKLNQINLLSQKHQANSVEELIAVREDLEQKLQKGFSVDELIKELLKESEKVESKLNKSTAQIRKNRLKVIPKIEKEILNTLHQLGMPNAQMSFELKESKNFNNFGKDDIQLLFSANKGIAQTSIEKSVSGGERSRLMLAIKQSVAKHKDLPTLILDEIDTGVSGKIAGSMGHIMHEASQHLQIIAITHLPQVAAYGKQHFKVEKVEKDKSTQTQVNRLNTEERIMEIAQMLSGEKVSEAAKAQAQELLKAM